MNFPGEGDQGSRGTGEGPPKMEAGGWDLQKKRKEGEKGKVSPKSLQFRLKYSGDEK